MTVARRSAPLALALALGGLAAACSRQEPPAPSASASTPAPVAAPEPPPRLLYLPDSGDVAPSGTPPPALGVAPPPSRSPLGRCPPEMVDVAGAYCIDRWESQLTRADDGRPLSPYYPPRAATAKRIATEWPGLALRTGGPKARAMPLPSVPDWQTSDDFEPRAISRAGVTPAGYISGLLAERACANAGKRLCTAGEWVRACRGEQGRKYPYGARYVEGACNVFREAHPAALLHDDASTGHLDPRLNQVRAGTAPLLRATGATGTCRSEWGTDAVLDMVGNLDEWVADERGAFHGGFYARSTREGCDARITSHPRSYFDYSLGVRCCR